MSRSFGSSRGRASLSLPAAAPFPLLSGGAFAKLRSHPSTTKIMITRRRFLDRSAAALAATPLAAPAFLSGASPNAKVSIACVGVGGMGWNDLRQVAEGHEIVAVCDIDEERLARAKAEFPGAKSHADWRQLLEQPGIDAVVVSTPDHSHAPVAAAAMGLGLHCYVQKPLAHSVHEARQLARLATEHGVITQMGIQHRATRRIKTALHALREDRVIGRVSEVHAWTDRPVGFWDQGIDRPAPGGSAPETVIWDLWLGTAPERPWAERAYHPFRWRGWWDFGTGVIGDMACHILDPMVAALDLGAPSEVWSEGPPPHPESGPEWLVVHYRFPGTERTAETLEATWYEAGRMPPRELFEAPDDWPGSKNGLLFVGEEGRLFVGFPEMPELFPRERFAGYEWADLPDHNHYHEWTSAIRDSGGTTTPFSYSGPLTEMALLGNVAHRSGAVIEWDSESLRVGNHAAANEFLRREYRKGWEVPGL